MKTLYLKRLCLPSLVFLVCSPMCGQSENHQAPTVPQAVLRQRVSLEVVEGDAISIISKIGEATRVNFIFRGLTGSETDDEVFLETKFTIKVKDAPVGKVLALLEQIGVIVQWRQDFSGFEYRIPTPLVSPCHRMKQHHQDTLHSSGD